MIVLGIESTAHTFGVGVVSDEPPFILADIRKKYRPKTGGILPREVASFFSEVAGEAVREALEASGVTPRDIDGVAVALGPGMGPALRVGATVARALAVAWRKPLVPVNHAVAHLEIARFTAGLRDPVILYVAGGNTMVTAFLDGRYRVFGETLDIALGNLLDTFAREVGIAPPYFNEKGHVVDQCAEGGEFLEDFPYVVKGQDVSFSGLLTAALKAVKSGARLADVCLTLREIAYASVVEVTERCLAHTGKKEVTVTGGVASNEPLRAKMEVMAKSHGAVFKPVAREYAVDNGVMIALAGLAALREGVIVDPLKSFVRQRWRVDEVDVPWYPWLPGF